jgi:hypothetical protein
MSPVLFAIILRVAWPALNVQQPQQDALRVIKAGPATPPNSLLHASLGTNSQPVSQLQCS